MALTFPRPPGLSDIPPATFGENKPVYGSHFQAVHENSMFGAVRIEWFHGNYKHGDTVPLPVSDVDGYSYERSELIYIHEFVNSANPDTGRVENKGQMRWFWKGVDPNTGVVHSIVSYKVRDGKTTDTNDGLLSVTTIGVRGKGKLSLSTPPPFNDTGDGAYDLDSAVRQDRMRSISNRSKLTAVVPEVFDLGEFADGDTVTAPTSDVDGYVYSHAETVYLPMWVWTVKDSVTTPEGEKTERSGVGTIRELTMGVNATTGLVDTSIRYRKNDLLTTDGRVRVVAFCTRSGLSLAAQQPAWTTVNDSKFLPFNGQSIEDATMVAINKNTKFSLMRPEVFVGEYSDPISIPTPTSPIDGYAYSASEMFPIHTYVTSTPKTGVGQITQINTFVGAISGFINLLYKRSGDSDWAGDGKVRVVTLAYRDEVAVSPAAGPSAKGGAPVPLDNPDIFLSPINSDFSSWSELTAAETVEVADYWEETDDSSGATYIKDLTSAIFGIAVQKITVPTGVGNIGGVVSSPIPVKPGQLIRLVADALASVATTDGFSVRVHLHDADESSSVYFDLFSDQAVPVTITEFDSSFIIPADTDTTVVVAGGTESIVGTLNFDPALVRVEVRIEDPNVTSTFNLDRVLWTLVDKKFFDVNTRVLEPARLLASHVTYRPTSNPLTATDAGATVTVDIAAFTNRIAGDDKSINTGDITGLSFNTLYYIYYDDAEFGGGAVTFVQTTTKETAMDSKDRFFIGSIRTPVNGGPDTVGNNDGGSGAQYGQTLIWQPSVHTVIAGVGYTNPLNAIDSDFTTASVNATITQSEWSGFPSSGLRIRTNYALKIDSEIAVGAVGTYTLRYSLDDGASWTNIYSIIGARVRQVDKINLSSNQNAGLIRVDAGVGAGTASHSIYEIWIEEEF